ETNPTISSSLKPVCLFLPVFQRMIYKIFFIKSANKAGTKSLTYTSRVKEIRQLLLVEAQQKSLEFYPIYSVNGDLKSGSELLNLYTIL
ncbi:MAG: hypothetical protein ACK55Z_14415, partial [bacterium]